MPGQKANYKPCQAAKNRTNYAADGPEKVVADGNSKKDAEEKPEKNQDVEQIYPRRLGRKSDERIFFGHSKELCFLDSGGKNKFSFIFYPIRVFRVSRFLNSKLKIQNSKLQKLVPFLLDWFGQNARDLPWRRTQDPYAIWVSEIMLQQTQVKTVLPFWERWMREVPTIESAARARSQKIHKLWEGLGYYTRVRNLQNAARTILEKHGGK